MEPFYLLIFTLFGIIVFGALLANYKWQKYQEEKKKWPKWKLVNLKNGNVVPKVVSAPNEAAALAWFVGDTHITPSFAVNVLNFRAVKLQRLGEEGIVWLGGDKVVGMELERIQWDVMPAQQG